jgi:hypothetical protein
MQCSHPSLVVPYQGTEASSTRGVPYGADGVKSAEVPTNVKEVLARFVSGAMPAAAERLSDHCPVVVEIQDRDLAGLSVSAIRNRMKR